jgi:two-component system response regulator YesN
MYSVLIVDDEELVVERLKYGINWNEVGFMVCGWAYDGREAMKKIHELSPDVVVTDIRMPIMDGLQLVKQMEQNVPTIRKILLSGYAEFEYAREAMKYGVDGYCLKPVSEEEFRLVLEKVAKKLDNRTWQQVYMFENVVGERGSLQQLLTKSGLKCGKPMRVLFGPNVIHSPFPKPHYTMTCGKNLRMWIFNEKQLPSIIEVLEEISISKDVLFGLSSQTYCQNGLQKAMAEARIASYQWFIAKKQGIQPYPDATIRELVTLLSYLEDKLCSSCNEEISKAFSHFHTVIKNGRYHIRHVVYAFNYIIETLDKERKYDINIQYEEELLEYFRGLEDMVNFFIQLSHNNTKLKDGEIRIENIVEYICMHFMEHISLGSVAEKFFINPDYLCRLFRQETGVNFTNYLTNLRIRYACELLKNSELPIHLIAEQCGFQSYFYFARVFKQQMGVTPTQYRNDD